MLGVGAGGAQFFKHGLAGDAVAADDEDAVAGFGEPPGDRGTHAARAAGDEDSALGDGCAALVDARFHVGSPFD